jgi:type III pantothenate kinase
MKTTYTIDNGNSHPHVGIFKGVTLEKVIALQECRFEEINSDIILSSVGKDLNLSLKNIFDAKKLRTENHFLDMPVNYTQTLGIDRLCCSYWIFKNKVKENEKILLIDAGTFTTFDIVSKAGLEGGFIFPGLQTFLNTYSGGKNLIRLNLNDLKLNEKVSLPHSTEEAIGEATKIYFQMTVKALVNKYNPDMIISTGGEGHFFSTNNFIPHLIHQALFEINNSISNRTVP